MNWLDTDTELVHCFDRKDEILGFVHMTMKCQTVFLLHKQTKSLEATRFDAPDSTATFACVLEKTDKFPTCIGCAV